MDKFIPKRYHGVSGFQVKSVLLHEFPTEFLKWLSENMYSVRLDEVDRFVVFFDVGEDMYDSDTMVINVGDFVYRDGDTFRHMTQREFESDWTPYDNEV